jgi:hypothetical protein
VRIIVSIVSRVVDIVTRCFHTRVCVADDGFGGDRQPIVSRPRGIVSRGLGRVVRRRWRGCVVITTQVVNRKAFLPLFSQAWEESNEDSSGAQVWGDAAE